MGDEEHGCAGIVHQRCQQIDDLPLRDRIQRGGWLVGDNQARRRDQCGRDADALLLSAGKFMRIFVQHIFRQPDFGEHCFDTVQPFVTGQIVMQTQWQRDLLRHGHHRIQCGGRILEHHAHITATQIGDRLIRRSDDFSTTHVNTAGNLRGKRQQAHDGFGDHGFAGTGRTDQTHTFTVGDVHIDIMHNRHSIDDDIEITDADAHARSSDSTWVASPCRNAGFVSGSMASRNASPNRFSAITIKVTTNPGHTTAIG